MKLQVVLCIGVGLAACGKGKDKAPESKPGETAASGSGSAAPADEAAAKKPAGAEAADASFVACSLLTVEEATAAMGKPMKPRVPDSKDAEYCNYDADAPGATESIALTVKPGAHMVEGQASMKGTEVVSGLGDKASWNRMGSTGMLAIAKNGRSVQITVSAPSDSDPRPIADKAAAAVVPRL